MASRSAPRRVTSEANINYLALIFNDWFLSRAFLYVFIAVIFYTLLFGKLTSFLLFSWFVAGGFYIFDFRKRHHQIPSLCPRTLPNSTTGRFECGRCKRLDCEIHTKLYIICPWRNLQVSQEVDLAIEDILNAVLREYVYPWYSLLSSDEVFIQELRVILRHVIAALIKRVERFNLAQFITGKMIHIIAQHLDIYVRSRRSYPQATDIEELVLSCYGKNMHVALKSRRTEYQYLRKLTEKILISLLPEKYYHSTSAFTLIREILCGTVFLNGMDVIADPDIINLLLLIFFDKTPMQTFPKSKKSVEILSHFVNQNAPTVRCNAPANLDLQTLLKTKELYSGFAQFLKGEGCQHLLWFYESLETFNSKLLPADINSTQIDQLHQLASNIYHRFISDEAMDRVVMEPSKAAEFFSVIQMSKENILKLRTSTVLYEAYEDVYHLLDKILVPQFLQSERYFAIVCKERESNAINHYTKADGPHKSPSVKPNANATKVGNATFWATVQGVDHPDFEEEYTQFEKTAFSMHDDPRLKDLSAWRVSIPRIGGHEHNEGCYFVIDVQRIDVKEDERPEDLHWVVGRKYNEFYVLEAKLQEFHGELPIQALPPKKSFGTRKRRVLEENMSTFERYIQELLTLPSLRGSQLVNSFLRVNKEFAGSFLPEVKLGKMIRNVPRRLVREKGQHLEEFLQTFLSSTEAPKVKAGIASKETTPTKHPDLLKSQMFGDNANSYSFLTKPIGSPEIPDTQWPIYDYVIYLSEKVFKADFCVTTLLKSLAPLIRYTVQDAVESLLDSVLKTKALVPNRLALLVNLLREVVFEDEPRKVSQEDRNQRSEEVLKEMKEFLPKLLVSFLTRECNDRTAELIHDVIQHPLLNKQLSYVLLDSLLIELFPEFEC